MIKLKDWLPQEFFMEYMDTPTAKYLEWNVIKEHSAADDNPKRHPFKHRNIYHWCVITNGKKFRAVAWNENPAVGWSFPNKLIEKE